MDRLRKYFILLIPLLAGLLFLLYLNVYHYFSFEKLGFQIATIVAAIVGVAALLINYLSDRRSHDNIYSNRSIGKATLDADQELDELRAENRNTQRQLLISQKNGPGLSESDKENMLKALREQFATSLTAEFEKQQRDALAEKRGLVPIRRLLDSASSHLLRGLMALSRRGNLNLVIGTLTTCAAVGLLIYMVLGQNMQNPSVSDLLSYYIPRISTVIFIEIFGFFFLRLYKTSLFDLKYYQNELTTIALISVAVEMAAREPSTESFVSLARCLVQCDRNHTSLALANHEQSDDKLVGGVVKVIQELTKLIPTSGKG